MTNTDRSGDADISPACGADFTGCRCAQRTGTETHS